MLIYTINVLQALKSKGYNTNRIRKEKLLAEGALQSLRTSSPISWKSIEKICQLLECQPGDFIKWIPDGETAGGE